MHFRDDKFLISCAARSGSSMLCTLIDSHPQALCHHEVFAQETPPTVFGIYGRKRKDSPEFERLLRRYRDQHPRRFLYDIVFNPQGRRCVGFKLKTDEVFQPRYRFIRELAVGDRDIKIIHLIRRNLLDQYVSHRVVERTGITFIRPTEKRPQVTPFTVDIEHFIAYVRDVKERQQAAFDLYRHHRSLILAYEDIVAPQSTALDDLQGFLNIDHRPLSPDMAKIIRNNDDLVVNLQDVQDAWARESANANNDEHAERWSLEVH
ncbi:MAG: hypothetical protein F4220_08875 [Gammaproteobacteria bacterium]|nr:hypothetical protein [Gammaproteobacteria bacterium]